jgi:hypothetical protein
MRVGIIQSCYIPWRGYFDFIHDCDLFILHDDIQYTKGDWRNRNRIKTPQGTRWLTVPVHYAHTGQLICDTKIDYSTNWVQDHMNQFAANYRTAPYWDVAAELLGSADEGFWPPETISELNARLLTSVMLYLGIRTPVRHSIEFGLTPELRKTERILSICKAVGATHYLSGPAARVYLDEDALRREGITPEYKVYAYPEYPQQHGRFEPNVSVLDLIANVGPKAPDYIWGPPHPYAKPAPGIHISHTLGGD